jgi:hypothetical protein
MSSASQSTDAPIDLDRAAILKRQLCEFVTKGALRDRYEQHEKLFLELCDAADEGDRDSILDWFLFDWLDERGEGTIGHFLKRHAQLSESDQNILQNWEDSIHSVFEIMLSERRRLKLRDLDGGDTFDVLPNREEVGSEYRKGGCLAARLLPIGEWFILSGPRFPLPDRDSALEALRINRSIEQLDSPESLESAQRELHGAFKEFFGSDEVSGSPVELKKILERFQRYLLFERKDPKDSTTLAEKFHCAFGRALKMPLLPSLPRQFGEVGEVTVLCDEFDGIVFLPDYSEFKKVFGVRDLDSEISGWRDLMWRYVKDPEIPLVAFERVAEEALDRVERVVRILIDDNSFSGEHLYAFLLHYKEPVEGLDNLKDEERLWDILNGNAGVERARKERPGSGRSGAAAKPASPRSAGARTGRTAHSKKR